MSATDDQEWGEWRDAWQEPAPGAPFATPAQARLRVHRTGRAQLVRTIAEGLGALLLIWSLAHLAAVHGTRAAERWAALGTANVLLIWAGSLLNRLGTWRPLTTTTRGFLDLATLRARRARRAATALALLLALELLALTGWLALEGALSAAGSEEWVFRLVVLGAALTGIVAALIRIRHARLELEHLHRLAEEEV